MSLVDPKNPALWLDGTPRSQNNAFAEAARAYAPGEDNWLRRANADNKSSRRSSVAVDKNRAAGGDMTVKALVYGKQAHEAKLARRREARKLRRAIEQKPHGGAYMKARG